MPITAQAGDKVGVGNKRLAERRQIDRSVRKPTIGALARHATGQNQRRLGQVFTENAKQAMDHVRNRLACSLIAGTVARLVHDMHISDATLA